MAKALGIGGEERSNFILVQRPDEQGNYSSIKDIQDGKGVQYHAISPEDLLLPKTQQEPSVWMLGLTISYMYTRSLCVPSSPFFPLTLFDVFMGDAVVCTFCGEAAIFPVIGCSIAPLP